jgi:hypothetical protein
MIDLRKLLPNFRGYLWEARSRITPLAGDYRFRIKIIQIQLPSEMVLLSLRHLNSHNAPSMAT